MDYYNPRLSHAVMLVLAAFAIYLVGGILMTDEQFAAAKIASAAFVLFSILVMAWINNRERIAFYDSMTRFSEAIRQMDNDQWQALGIRVPALRVRWHGRPVQMIEDTDITVDDLEGFMEDSTASQISPVRNWSNGIERRRWERIKSWLESQNYIVKNSAAGSHSWLWRGQSFYTVKERYLAEQQIKSLAEDDVTPGPPATAYTPPLEAVSGSQQ